MLGSLLPAVVSLALEFVNEGRCFQKQCALVDTIAKIIENIFLLMPHLLTW